MSTVELKRKKIQQINFVNFKFKINIAIKNFVIVIFGGNFYWCYQLWKERVVFVNGCLVASWLFNLYFALTQFYYMRRCPDSSDFDNIHETLCDVVERSLKRGTGVEERVVAAKLAAVLLISSINLDISITDSIYDVCSFTFILMDIFIL